MMFWDEIRAAINASAIWTAFRPVDLRCFDEPAFACKNLVRFERDCPVYRFRFYTRGGLPVAGAAACRFTGWFTVDPTDPVTSLGDLLDRENITERQERMVERKKRRWMILEGTEYRLFARLVQAYDQLRVGEEDAASILAAPREEP